jgi:hypothetical protein
MARRTAAWPANPAEVDVAIVPRRRTGVHGVEIDSESVLYDARRARLHHLNWSASAVWWSIDGTTSIDQLAAELAGRFGTTNDVMRSDLLALLGVLGEQQLVDAVRARTPRASDV